MSDSHRQPLFDKLAAFGITDKETFWAEAFSRDIGLLSREEQWRLAKSRVAIPGLGGVGGVHIITLARAGVGNFHISDLDKYELANMNRQFGATVPSLGLSKVEVMRQEAHNINPFIEIREFPSGITEENIDDFLHGVDVVLDGIDFFCFNVRRLVFKKALAKGIPVVTAGPMGFSAAFLVFTPGGMGFDEYFDVNDSMPQEECVKRFLLGLSPAATQFGYTDLSRISVIRKKGPSMDVACQLCSAVACTEAIRLILGRPGLKPVPHYHQFDPYALRFVSGRLLWGNRGPIQRLKRFIITRQFNKEHQEFKRLPPPNWPSQRVRNLPVPDDVMNSVLIAGSYAPSLQNTQPWSVIQKASHLSVYQDRSRLAKLTDPSDLGMLLSIGCFLENISIASSTFGLKTNIHENTTPGDTDLVAEVDFEPADVPRDFLFESIWERHTNRKKYSSQPLPDAAFEEFKIALGPFPGAKIHWLKSLEDFKKVESIAYRADRIWGETPKIRQWVHDMIRWDMDEVMKKKDGYPLGNLQAGFLGELYLRWVLTGGDKNILNWTGIGSVMASRHIARLALSCSAIGLMTFSGLGRVERIKAGRALERFWLMLTYLGYVIQPLTPINLFWHQWREKGKESFMSGQQDVLEKIWADYRQLFSGADFENDTHVMMFRIGRATPMRWASPRRPPEMFRKFA